MAIKQFVFGIFLLAVGVACSPLRQIEIETFNPSAVSFPAHTKRVLIANNAVAQPKGNGITLLGSIQKAQKTDTMSVDSALFDACKALGEALVMTNRFADVRLLHHALRSDNNFSEDKKLTQTQVQNLCKEHQVDAIITLDKLLFEQKRHRNRFVDGQVLGIVEMKINGLFRVYLPEREQALALVPMKDSICWEEFANTEDILAHYLPSPTKAFREAARYASARTYHCFAPHWSREYRWYYIGVGAKWKEASSYVNVENWEKAAERWEEIYKKTSSSREKARAASNLALAKELSGDFKTAYSWLYKSYELFRKEVSEKNKETYMTKLYINTLSERIRNDRKLNKQLTPNN